MAENKDYKVESIVLRWVKLRETDVIVKMVDSLGCLVEGVARGARKPNNATSSKLEPFNCVEAFLAKGRGLDIVKDCRVVQRNDILRSDPCKFSCASTLSELLCKSLQPDIDVPRIYGLTRTFISELGKSPDDKRLSLTAASLLKAASYLGFMPSLSKCVICGEDISSFDDVAFSYTDGGVACRSCKGFIDYSGVDPILLSNANAFLHMRLADIASSNSDENVGADVMRFAASWIKMQAGISMKSLPLALEICSC